ncbi:MAG: DUF2934 domain-containing protein [Phycisphaerales bacterium]|nr:MAG: DUF2934 domain-containing protein [Phycisphaerales bacterium]
MPRGAKVSPAPKRTRKPSAEARSPAPQAAATLKTTEKPARRGGSRKVEAHAPEAEALDRAVPFGSVELKVPTHEQIAARAYELYLERGCEDGHAQEDWVRAERELLSR